MTTAVTLDEAGRVVMPKALRDELHLAPGDLSALEAEGDSVNLRPVQSASHLRKKRGVWVFHGGGKTSAAVPAVCCAISVPSEIAIIANTRK